MQGYVVQNIDNVINSSNEIINRHVINRNFEKLLENDKALDRLLNSPEINKSGVKAYAEGLSYDKDDLVWFAEGSNLFLLRSLVANNSNRPVLAKTGKVPGFEQSGWRDEYQYGSIADSGLSSYIIGVFNSNIETNHARQFSFHKFGELTDVEEYDDTKLLRSDFSNALESRSANFWPYETVMLSSGNVVLNGFYRKWDQGLLEYDIVFSLGRTGETRTVNDTDYDVVKANTLVLEDAKYCNSDWDSDIFAQPGDDEVYVNGAVYVGLNRVCDSFAGRIEFPVPFKDGDYMVFGSDTVSQTRDVSNQTIDSGCNSMVYVNRTPERMDALLVIQPKKAKAYACLVSNSYHCQVIGRWK